MVTKSFVILVFCLISSICAFSPNWKLTPPEAAFQMDYSSDQKYIAIVNSSHVVIYEAEFGKKVQDLYLGREGLESFTFNADNTWIAAGFNDGEARLFIEDQGQFVSANKTYKHPTTTPAVKGVCFTSDSSHVVLGLFDDQIVTWKIQDGSTLSESFSNEQVHSVSCSPTDPKLFVVAGGLNTISKFTFYTYNDTEISVAHDASGTALQSAMSSKFSSDGLFAYRTERNGIIYRYDTTLFTEQKLEIPELAGNSLTKIRISNDYMFIAVAYTDKAVIITNSTSINALTVQQFDSVISSVALAPRGGHFLYVNTNGEAQVSGQCPNGQYLSEGACVACNAGCAYCDLSPDSCFSCTPKYYLNNNQCLNCVPGCQVCTEGTICETCDEVGHFVKNISNLCNCQTAYFLRQQQCLACGIGCEQCVDQTQCTTCKSEFDNIGGLCKCKAGTYASLDTCLSCGRACLQCSNGTVCQACDVEDHYTISNDKCICDPLDHVTDDGTNCPCSPGYYDQQNVCLQCPLGCKTCQSTTFCSDCVLPQFVVRNDMCKCADTASYITFDLTCQKCQTGLTYCIECTDAYTCTSCQAGIHRSVNDGKCLCDQGYYEDTNLLCQLCSVIDGCLTCTSQTNCLTCDADKNWQNDPTNNLCRCKKHFSQDSGTCYQCGVGCARCDKTECLECDDVQHWVADGTGCKCEPSYYEDTEQCLQCQPGCLECVNGAECITCDQAGHFDNIDGICDCVEGYYLDGRICQSCSQSIPYCKLCSPDGQQCQTCIGSLEVIDNQCGCQKGKWINEQVCSDCPEGCTECDDIDTCTACVPDYDLENGVCKKSGLDTLIIVLIIVGVIVLAGAVFVVVKCIKKRRLPANDDYEEL